MASQTLHDQNLTNSNQDESAQAPVDKSQQQVDTPKETQVEQKEVQVPHQDTEMGKDEAQELETPRETEEKGRKRNSKGDDSAAKKSQRKGTPASTEPATPTQRPSRERKLVQRYAVPSSEKVSATKAFTIHKGQGTPFKDIPNVAFKLSKRKADENLKLLHTILFGKRTKTYNLKRNILQFSGFVWVENEEKQRAKLKEKLDKCVKEKLLDFCDVLDIPVSKTTTKKDEVAGKILEFLESPHPTTEVLLAEKEQSRKRKKRKQNAGSASKDSSSKKRKQVAEAKKKENNPSKSEENAEDESESESESADKLLSDEDHNAVVMHKEESEHEDEQPPEEDDKTDAKEIKKSSGKKILKRCAESKVRVDKDSPSKLEKSTEPEKSPTKSIQSPAKMMNSPDKTKESPSKFVQRKESKTNDKVSGSHSKLKKLTSKSQKGSEKKSKVSESSVSENQKRSKKEQNKSGMKASTKEGRNTKGAVTEPTREEMHAAVSGILKEVDFNTATLSDILKKLEKRFSTNLMHRKSEVKTIIEEVISNMTDDEDEGEEDEDADNGSEGADENTDN